ncbi:MAG: T9SS type A sorting domain-containing protein, partial [Chlorobi bacterium]|nr:T9SS type A sorting domain-containing protein [Chlorobiota bacterium]
NDEIENWVDNFINTYTYDENGALLLLFGQYWNVEAGEWINSSQMSIAYNENGNMIENYSQIWDELANEWSNSWKYDYFWSEHELTAIVNNPVESINIYPNPTQGKIKINVNIPLQNTSVRVVSVSGKLLKTISLKSQNEIDISDFQKGIYFLHFQTPKGYFIRKIIKN